MSEKGTAQRISEVLKIHFPNAALGGREYARNANQKSKEKGAHAESLLLARDLQLVERGARTFFTFDRM
jgi:hypothetical protein